MLRLFASTELTLVMHVLSGLRQTWRLHCSPLRPRPPSYPSRLAEQK